MTMKKAREVARFLKSNDVFSVNLMGGEVFCNPEWRDIARTLAESVTVMRIVSNGDWAVAEPDFADVVGSIRNCYVTLSKDKWHTNANIELAERLLKDAGVQVRVSDLNEKEETMVPIGRSRFEHGFYSFMGCYCRNPEHQYSFLIDENGRIFKCGFGVWDYDGIDEYIDGGFRQRFKEFNKRFYGIWIPHCKACIRSYESKY
jgi:MoaA/NifB/PqqE/SkfB family radical SAM enzyme